MRPGAGSRPDGGAMNGEPPLDGATGLEEGQAAGVLPEAGELLFEQRFISATLYALREAAQAHASAAGMPEVRVADLALTVHELAANAIAHGAGQGQVRMWNRDGMLRCEIRDTGKHDAFGQVTADGWPYEHGHGLWLARTLADHMSVVSDDGGTCVTVVFAPPTGPEERDAMATI